MPEANRASIIRHALELRGMDGLLLLLPENILFGSGYWPSTSAALFIPTGGRSTLIIPKPDRGFIPRGWAGEVLAYDTRLEDDPSDLFIAKLVRTAAGSKGTGKRRFGCDRCMETIAGTHIGGEARVPGEPFYKLLAEVLPQVDFIDLTPWIYEARMVKTP
jgi:Xaa-Pro aminopeptidase